MTRLDSTLSRPIDQKKGGGEGDIPSTHTNKEPPSSPIPPPPPALPPRIHAPYNPSPGNGPGGVMVVVSLNGDSAEWLEDGRGMMKDGSVVVVVGYERV